MHSPSTTPKLIDLCPQYAAQLDAFEACVERGDMKAAERAWEQVVLAAKEYKKLKVAK